jgi:hypothetical protein
MYGSAAPCKRNYSSAGGAASCITYQASNVQRFSPAPGQHGHARAFDRISGHVSMGQNGSPGLECAVKTFLHASLLSSRRHSAATSATDHGPIVFRPVPFGPHFRLLLPAQPSIIPGREGDRHCIARFRRVDSGESLVIMPHNAPSCVRLYPAIPSKPRSYIKGEPPHFWRGRRVSRKSPSNLIADTDIRVISLAAQP